MVCRCSSQAEHARRATIQAAQSAREQHRKEVQRLQTEIANLTVKADLFEILEAEEINDAYLILKVKYPSCKDCYHEGVKIMVFEGVSAKDALKWRRIDPHFRTSLIEPKEAPSPIARFPGTDAGWQMAIDFTENL